MILILLGIIRIKMAHIFLDKTVREPEMRLSNSSRHEVTSAGYIKVRHKDYTEYLFLIDLNMSRALLIFCRHQ